MVDFSEIWDAQRDAWEAWLATGRWPAIRDDIDHALALSARC